MANENLSIIGVFCDNCLERLKRGESLTYLHVPPEGAVNPNPPVCPSCGQPVSQDKLAAAQQTGLAWKHADAALNLVKAHLSLGTLPTLGGIVASACGTMAFLTMPLWSFMASGVVFAGVRAATCLLPQRVSEFIGAVFALPTAAAFQIGGDGTALLVAYGGMVFAVACVPFASPYLAAHAAQQWTRRQGGLPGAGSNNGVAPRNPVEWFLNSLRA
jgi:hypothetical protein